MQSLHQAVARTVVEDRRRRAAASRAVAPSERGASPPGLRRPAAVLAVRVARRLDADAACAELTRLA